MRNKNVLVAGSHPDDMELGCGGTISKHLDLGDKVYVLIMTNGERGNHASQMEECKDALNLMGITEIILGNFPDGYIKDDHATVNFIEEVIKKYKIDRVYTHYPDDRHQDHRNCSRAVSAAARKVPEILFFQGPSTHPTFEPHLFIEISKNDLKKKLDALRCYKTQIEKGIVDLRWIESLAVVNGSSCNKDFAEAFTLNHLIKEGRDV